MAEKFILSNGTRLLLEYMPHLRSVSTGVWADTGSAREDQLVWGVSHLLEHMLFKGTAEKTALQISSIMDNVGGVLNAFTAKEQTCYYTRCLDEHFEMSLSLLADMYCHSLLDETELEREKGVVIEEINMYEDSPDEQALDLFAATLWPNHPLGRTISGTVTSVTALGRPAVADYLCTRYNTADTVIAIAGNVSADQAVSLAERYFSDLPNAKYPHAPLTTPKTAAGYSYTPKEIEQNHICLGLPGLSLSDDDYYTAAVINSAFGGSASARLFQEVREKRGLSYSAFSYLETFSNAGFLMAYAAAQPEKTALLAQVMAHQFARLREEGLSDDEINRSKDQIKGTLLLQMEGTGAVMSKLGKSELVLGRLYSAEQTAERIMAVTPDDVRRVITRLIDPEKLVLAQVGPTRLEYDPREAFI